VARGPAFGGALVVRTAGYRSPHGLGASPIGFFLCLMPGLPGCYGIASGLPANWVIRAAAEEAIRSSPVSSATWSPSTSALAARPEMEAVLQNTATRPVHCGSCLLAPASGVSGAEPLVRHYRVIGISDAITPNGGVTRPGGRAAPVVWRIAAHGFSRNTT